MIDRFTTYAVVEKLELLRRTLFCFLTGGEDRFPARRRSLRSPCTTRRGTSRTATSWRTSRATGSVCAGRRSTIC
ncbi:MAG: hypothetical protein R6X25_04720 [Candidatus Krumholzibacteriia bacterium]